MKFKFKFVLLLFGFFSYLIATPTEYYCKTQFGATSGTSYSLVIFPKLINC